MSGLELRRIELRFGFWYKSVILVSGMFMAALQIPLSNLRGLDYALGFFFVLTHILYLLVLYWSSPLIVDRFSTIWLVDSLTRLAFAGYLMVLVHESNSGIIIYFPLVLLGILLGQPTLKSFFLFGGTSWLFYSAACYLNEGVAFMSNLSYWRNATLMGFFFFGGVMVVQEIARLAGLATTDVLTGLGNRRFFNQKLAEEVSRARRYVHDLSLIMLDLDEFKYINDRLGHPVGDQVLASVGDLIAQNLRVHDVACRYGGDEFAIILPETGLYEAKRVAERLTKVISETRFPGQEKLPSTSLTASAGVATFPLHCHNAQELLEKADKALVHGAKKLKIKNSVTIYSAILERGAIQEEDKCYPEELELITSCINAKDQYTRQHSQRVAEYASALAEKMGLSNDLSPEILWMAGLVHDIGKIEIPKEILLKKERLDENEWAMLKKHPEFGLSMLSIVHASSLLIPIIKHHHERYDGSGYPEGLRGDDIPLGARILAVVDAYDAMRSDRPYRPALTKNEAIEELKKGAGKQFDPDIVATFVDLLKELDEKIGDDDGA